MTNLVRAPAPAGRLARGPCLASHLGRDHTSLVDQARRHTDLPPFVARQSGVRHCDCDGCSEPATNRAPRSRDNPEDFLWFCRVHAREYNSAWNWCAGMSQEEIDARLRRDVVWDRPTWPLGAGMRAPHTDPDDPLELFGRRTRRKTQEAERRWPPGSPERRALRVLDLAEPVTMATVKARYKELAKKLHPDRNGGCKSSEDRLKEINQAYATLRKSLSP